MTKHEFNVLVATEVLKKHVAIARETEPAWYWLVELSAYFELKHLGYE